MDWERVAGEEDGELEDALSQGGTVGLQTRGLTCGRCRVTVPAADRLAHYKSPWHLHNLRRSLGRKPPLSLEEYRRLCEEEGQEDREDEEARRTQGEHTELI